MMKKHRVAAFLFIFTAVITGSGEKGLAMDKSGCLTCHQYPGLARPEMPEGFKVFHIDEARYLASAHGKNDCLECHVDVEKVPHVGKTAVNCTNCCHAASKDRERIAKYDLDKHHAGEKSYITRLADGSSCRECHRLYPHKSSKLARSFINMHIGFMTCETCHINRDKYTPLYYDWTSSEAADFAGEPFGARFNPNITEKPESTHFISRISPFTTAAGKPKPLFNTWDTAVAKAFNAKKQLLNLEEKKAQLDFFHRDIHKAEISVTCNECHSKESILDFQALGFSEKKAMELIYLNIKGMVTKYKIFYFPKMIYE